MADLRRGPILFLEHLNQPLGFAWLRYEAPNRSLVEPIGIKPEYQRQGLGRQLLLAAISELVKRGATSVQLGVWRQNKPALHLYSSLGFKTISQRIYLARDTQIS